jgi:hypothetical protein
MYIVGSIQLHGRIIMGISPLTLTGNHLPPYTYVLHRMNPGGILDLARLIEIENQVGRQYLTITPSHHLTLTPPHTSP